MKPRNKFQARVLEASKELPKISETQVKWAYKNCIPHIARRTKKGIVACLECGHEWEDKTTKTHCTCPHCNIRLKIEGTKKRVFNDYEYFCIITACKGFQVLRFIYINYYAKVGRKANYFHSEVIQLWIAPSGKHATIAKLRPMSCFVDTWNFSSELELRPNKSFYNAIPTRIYPQQKVIPEIKRSGYSKQIDGLTPFDIFHFLLSENRAETLLKSGQITLFKDFAYNTSKNINNYWTSIKICIRNGYNIEDAQSWYDYIDLLSFFGKDLHNAKYVCPTDLKAQHDRYVQKKRACIEQQRKEKAKRKALEGEALFQELKSKFFGIQFSDGLIQVRVLESVQEIMLEGDAMHHCVFTNDYHLKPDSLILSACINGERVETIEISLPKLQVIQSRGVCNQNTEYHDRIVKLVNKNISLIHKRLAA
jgi:DNA-directed RNA polymerase subunit RPC12/RpoP